jgi:histidinol-phosphate phosphatase family protein
MSADYAVVIPTLGRPSLEVCLKALARAEGPPARRIVLVDDRPSGADSDPLPIPAEVADRTVVLRGGARGPAAARNTGWQAVDEEWVAFLDDDTVPGPTWARDLAADLGGAAPDVAGIQGRITVPLPTDRPPTDWERSTASLADAPWITADMAYRRAALEQVAGFDERFRRAYREDADIALRMLKAGWRLARGLRTTAHPVRPTPFWISVRAQAGNADDVLMRRLHGPTWRSDCGAPSGRLRRHLAITGSALAAAVLAGTRFKRPAAALAALSLAGIADFTYVRVRPGPRSADELGKMAVTSVAIPPAATAHWLRGLVRHRGAQPWTGKPSDQPDIHKNRFKSIHSVTSEGVKPAGGENANRATEPASPGGAGTGTGSAAPCTPWVHRREGLGHSQAAHRREGIPTAVLFDRDGTLVDDVPYNGDPAAVRVRPGVVEAIQALREYGIAVGVVTNQSGVARGLLQPEQVEAVHRRIEELIGPLDVWAICPHGPDDACGCRKPAPGLVLAAAEALGVPASTVVVIGDIGSDVQAAEDAGATGILVPTPVTRPEEVAAARRRARTVMEATFSVLPERARGEVR